jgi:hypothetical protein
VACCRSPDRSPPAWSVSAQSPLWVRPRPLQAWPLAHLPAPRAPRLQPGWRRTRQAQVRHARLPTLHPPARPPGMGFAPARLRRYSCCACPHRARGDHGRHSSVWNATVRPAAAGRQPRPRPLQARPDAAICPAGALAICTVIRAAAQPRRLCRLYNPAARPVSAPARAHPLHTAALPKQSPPAPAAPQRNIVCYFNELKTISSSLRQHFFHLSISTWNEMEITSVKHFICKDCNPSDLIISLSILPIPANVPSRGWQAIATADLL